MSLPKTLADCINLADLEALGRSKLDQNALEYYQSGANDEITYQANHDSYKQIKLRPRVLVDVAQIDTSTSILGLPIDSPVGIAPTAFHGLAHPEAEQATARAAMNTGTIYTLSTLSNTPMDAIGTIAAGRFWFQLYLCIDREISKNMIKQAEVAGAKALVFTVSAPYVGRREVNERHRFALPNHLGIPNIGPRQILDQSESDTGSQLVNYFQAWVEKSFTWRDIGWIREQTNLPIVLKGILTAEDAKLAVEHDCHIWISNHGGRQLDTAITTIEALPEIAEVVTKQVEIYLDGGITRGTDVIKALALGANAVFLGRAALWGLAAAGQEGVEQTLKLLNNEVQLAMALCGKQNIKQIDTSLLH